MYNATPTFLTKIKEASRVVKAKVVIDTTTLTEQDIISFTIEDSFGSYNMPAIGGVSAKKLTLEIINNNQPEIIIGKPIIPYIGIETSTGVYEYIPMGKFYADYDQIKKTDLLITIECFDLMPTLDDDTYVSALTFPATVTDMLTEIGNDYALTLHSQTLPSVSFPYAPIGTVRQVISQIAASISTNASFNRLGELEFSFTSDTSFTLNSSNYISFSLLSESIAKISELVVTKENEEDNLIYGDGTGVAISFDNEAITSNAELGVVFNRIYPLSFYAYEMTLQGMPHIDVGDKIVFTDKNNVVRTIIVSKHKIEYAGGVKSSFSTAAPEKQTTVTTATGTTIIGAASVDYAQLEAAALAASKLIVGNEGGYLKIISDANGHPTELVIMNTDDINTADKVWRWNSGGLGFSSTGYNGTYETAMTQDGQIVADFITTGKLNAGVVQVGSETTFETGYNSNAAFVAATTANNAITDLSNDNKLTPSEKQTLKIQWDTIVAEYTPIEAQATTFGITTEKTAYTSAYTTLSTYITPLLTDLTITSDITGSTLRTNFSAYNTAKVNLTNAINTAIKNGARPVTWVPAYTDITGTKPVINADKTSTVINGGLITTGSLKVGTGGIAGIKSTGNLRFWAGNTSPQLGTFLVENDGRVWVKYLEAESVHSGAISRYAGGAATGKSRYYGAWKDLVLINATIANSNFENCKGTFTEITTDNLTVNNGINSNQLSIDKKEITNEISPLSSMFIDIEDTAFIPKIVGDVECKFKNGGLEIINETDSIQIFTITYKYII